MGRIFGFSSVSAVLSLALAIMMAAGGPAMDPDGVSLTAIKSSSLIRQGMGLGSSKRTSATLESCGPLNTLGPEIEPGGLSLAA